MYTSCNMYYMYTHPHYITCKPAVTCTCMYTHIAHLQYMYTLSLCTQFILHMYMYTYTHCNMYTTHCGWLALRTVIIEANFAISLYLRKNEMGSMTGENIPPRMSAYEHRT